jgi:hypothetical protein
LAFVSSDSEEVVSEIKKLSVFRRLNYEELYYKMAVLLFLLNYERELSWFKMYEFYFKKYSMFNS